MGDRCLGGILAGPLPTLPSTQVTRSEFVLLWATYLAVMYGGLQAGIGAGIVFSTLYFAWAYARVRSSLPAASVHPPYPALKTFDRARHRAKHALLFLVIRWVVCLPASASGLRTL